MEHIYCQPEKTDDILGRHQRHYPDLGSARHQYRNFCARFSLTSFRGETVGGVAKCRLFQLLWLILFNAMHYVLIDYEQ